MSRAVNPSTSGPPPAGGGAARGDPPIGVWREAALMLFWYALSATALAWVFPPGGLWPLALVCLVPWAVATCRAHRAWLVHWLSFAVGFAFFLTCLRWLRPVTGLGYAALALYLALYWPLAAWAVRTARRHGISPVWSLPVTWVACEYLRAIVMTGFPWLFVAHGLYAQLPLIQIVDLTGAYGVTFLAVLINGVLVELALQRWSPPGGVRSRRQLVAGAITAAVLAAATVAYGYYRLGQADFTRPDARRGPRVAVIQHDFPLVSTPPYGARPWEILAAYLAVGAEAAREQPDLIVFPETVWAAVQNLSFIEVERAAVDSVHADTWAWGNLCHEAVSAFARGDYAAVNRVLARLERYPPPQPPPRGPAAGGPPVTVLVGSVSIEQFPEETYPKFRRYNSALVYDPDGTQRRQRYDKRHLVPFGEFVPFRQARFLGIDLHYWLYRPLNKLSPFSEHGKVEYSLTPGSEYVVFPLTTTSGTWTFGAPICYEDATPYVIREYTWDGPRRRVDFLVNISNDGWFQHSTELPQHLAICAFRAVENRVTIARAVNTGGSGFIDPNGRIYSQVRTPDGRAFGPGVVGYAIEHVYLDTRTSLYGRYGDWFAGLNLLLAGLLWLGAVFERWILAIKHRLDLLLKRHTVQT